MHQSLRQSDSRPASIRRRHLLAGFVGAYTATLVPWALAQPATDDRHSAFLALSAIIAGRQSLDTGMADRIFKALSDEHAGFPDAAVALLKLIEDRKIDPMQLQKTLDDEKSPLAPMPRQIATAWFLGVIGSGAKAYVIAYEHALNAQFVADVLKPPTYAYGPYGSWTRKPL
ncbi:sugar dehydrogenase complex small subunit [Castellaniella sp.]|uniref:sugar dehydrogenase complex small subunit n=1 Tax=Castellaniella sp. TaxID=1955812 RepID=UPI003C714D2B